MLNEFDLIVIEFSLLISSGVISVVMVEVTRKITNRRRKHDCSRDCRMCAHYRGCVLGPIGNTPIDTTGDQQNKQEVPNG